MHDTVELDMPGVKLREDTVVFSAYAVELREMTSELPAKTIGEHAIENNKINSSALVAISIPFGFWQAQLGIARHYL